MPGLIPERFIDELLARIDIVDVVQRHVPLKRAGREWTARCPFHDERTPSFYVSPAKQFFHCFGCGAHGSAIKFLMDYERLEFPDAVEELAQSVGLKVPRESGDERPREDKTDLYALLDAAAGFYESELKKNARAREYCDQRGLDAATIEHFRVGWAPSGWDGLKRALGTNDARMKLLEQAGMLSAGDRGNKFDRFRERLMFPILDRRGRVIAFGGRVLEAKSSAHPAREDQEAGTPGTSQQSQSPKYLNSPETPLFHKGRELFAFWQVRQANTKLERLLVVEGYMDAIALHQAGITQAVATLGTATTHEHAELLFRAAPDVVFCFDGDRAGRSAAWRALESVLPRMRDGRQAFFLFLPEGEDPDTLVRREGRAGFEASIAQALPLSEYFYSELSRDVNVATLDGRARLAEHAKPLLAKLPDGAFRDLMYAELEKRTGLNTGTTAPALPRAPARSGRSTSNTPRRTLVRSAIAMLLSEPSLASEAQPPYAFAALDKPGVPLLIELLDVARARPDINTAALLERFAQREESAALQKLAMIEFPGEPETLRTVFVEGLRRLTDESAQQRFEILHSKQREGPLDAGEKNELRELLARKRPAPAD